MGLDDTILDRLSAWRVRLPLREEFLSARTRLTDRQVVLLRVETGGHSGWGEAAPVPGHSDEDVDGLWETLRRLADNHGLGAARLSTGMLRGALNEAVADAAARRAGTPLWASLGGSRQVPASAAIGVDNNEQPDVAQLDAAATGGYRHVKLKITPRTDAEKVAQLVVDYPGIAFGVDANGSLGRGEAPLLASLDQIGLQYIEQPGDPDDLEWHSVLRRQLDTPVSLDESARSSAAISRILAADAADIVNLKAGRFGTIETLRIASDLAATGIRVRLGGLIESGVGRAHTVALATHPVFTVVGDIAGSDRYFVDDLVRPQWRIEDGQFNLPPGSGIGVAVAESAIAELALDSITVS